MLLLTALASSSNVHIASNAWSNILHYKEQITFFIALIGFLLSLYNFIWALIHNRVKLRVAYKNHLCGNGENGFLIVMMNIENLSRLPLSVSRMFLNIGDDTYEFSSMPQFVYERTRKCGDEVYDKVITHSVELPQFIPALGVCGGFFHVVGEITNKRLMNENTSITIWTTRGKRTYKILMNNEQHHPH